MKTIITIILFFFILSTEAQVVGTRNNPFVLTTEWYVTNSPTNTIGSSKMVSSLKDSTSWFIDYPSITYNKFGFGRNDGIPTSIAWFDILGHLQVSPYTPPVNINLIPGLGINIIGTYPNFTISRSKRQESYSGSTNASGIYSITFPTAYSISPNSQVNIIGGSNKMTQITTITPTGFSIYVQARADVLGLLPTYSNVSGQAVDVLITEK